MKKENLIIKSIMNGSGIRATGYIFPKMCNEFECSIGLYNLTKREQRLLFSIIKEPVFSLSNTNKDSQTLWMGSTFRNECHVLYTERKLPVLLMKAKYLNSLEACEAIELGDRNGSHTNKL